MKEYQATITMGATINASDKDEAESLLRQKYSEGLGFEVEFLNDEEED